jgi:uncharacterized zinc-type alcohol dehydrogenase-like protein
MTRHGIALRSIPQSPGTFCVVLQCGIPGGGAVIDLNLQDVVFGQKSMAGSIVGGRADMMEMLQFCGDKGVAPMVEVMKLSQVRF